MRVERSCFAQVLISFLFFLGAVSVSIVRFLSSVSLISGCMANLFEKIGGRDGGSALVESHFWEEYSVMEVVCW